MPSFLIALEKRNLWHIVRFTGCQSSLFLNNLYRIQEIVAGNKAATEKMILEAVEVYLDEPQAKWHCFCVFEYGDFIL